MGNIIFNTVMVGANAAIAALYGSGKDWIFMFIWLMCAIVWVSIVNTSVKTLITKARAEEIRKATESLRELRINKY